MWSSHVLLTVSALVVLISSYKTTTATQQVTVITVTLQTTAPVNLSDTTSTGYVAYVNNVKASLTAVYVVSVPGFLYVVIIQIIPGSVIVKHEIVTNKTEAAATGVSNVITDIGNQRVNFNLNNQNVTASSVTLARPGSTDLTVTQSTDECTVFRSTFTCATGSQCQTINGNAQCVPSETSDGFDLVVGLGVGIPVAFLALLIAVIVCVYSKRSGRRGSKDLESLDRTLDAGLHYPTGIAPKFNTWGRPAYYQPGGWHDPDSDSDSSDHKKRNRRDADLYQGRDYYVYDNPDTSNFSWDFMYQYVDPKQKYKIQRPNTDLSPNPVYVKK